MQGEVVETRPAIESRPAVYFGLELHPRWCAVRYTAESKGRHPAVFANQDT
jgi:hypothetical protein